MSKQVNPTAIGLFVTGAIVFVIGGIFILGSGRLFETRERFVAYFQSSANGLSEGSDVLLGGVKVGSVEKMLVDFDPETQNKVIPVVIALSANRIAALSPEARDEKQILSPESLDDAIGRGLRARLMSRSALTGQLYVDLEFLPGDPSGYTFPGTPMEGLQQIPSIKSKIQQVLETLAEGVEEVGEADLAGLINNIDRLVLNLDAKIAELDLKGISDSAKATLAHADETFAEVDETITEVDLPSTIANLNSAVDEIRELAAKVDTENIDTVLQNAASAMEQLRSAGSNIARLTDAEAPTSMRLNRTLAELDSAARSIREFAEYLKRNPSALVTGKKRP